MGSELSSQDSKTETLESFLSSEVGENIGVFVERNEWETDAGLVFRVLTHHETEEDSAYLEEKLGGLSYKMDNRTPVDYARELFMGWIVEDVIREMFQGSEFTVVLTGEDSSRVLLEETAVDPDLGLLYKGEQFDVEVITDYSGYWKSVGYVDLRDNKYPELNESECSLLLGVDLYNQSVFVEWGSKLSAEYTSEHPYWDKPAYRIPSETLEFVELGRLSEVARELVEN